MQFTALLLVLAHAVHSFLLPIKLASVVNQTEQAETLTQNNNYWTTTVIIGTPGTAFTVVVDLTFSVLLIPDVSSGWNNTFDKSKSSTFQNVGDSFWINSAFGISVGHVGQDTVILGESFMNDPKRTSITVPNATFGLIRNVPENMPVGIDGVLGLAYYVLGLKGTLPVFQSAINQHDVANGIFVISLEDQGANSDNGTHGVIYYGNNDNFHCQVRQRHVYPLSTATVFQFTLSSFSMSSPSGNYTYNTKSQTLITSTSPYIAAPPQVVASVLAKLGIHKNSALPATVPCNTKIDLAFNMPMGTEHVTELNLILRQPDGTCKLALINNYVIEFNTVPFELGIPFLRGRCTYFNVSNEKIGFSAPITQESKI